LLALRRSLESSLDSASERLGNLCRRLARVSPRFRLELGAQRLDECKARLALCMGRARKGATDSLGALAARLNALSPLAILGRGYAAVFDGEGSLLRSAVSVVSGQELRILLGTGELDAVVKTVHGERRK
ncbi:MAG: exodeoxyribonuclease VII large subunit, partial [bacterium]